MTSIDVIGVVRCHFDGVVRCHFDVMVMVRVRVPGDLDHKFSAFPKNLA